MVAEPHRHEHRPVSDGDIQAVRGGLGAELAFLQLHHRLHGLHQGRFHLCDRVPRLPGGGAPPGGEEGHVQGGEVLRVGRALEITVGGVVHAGAHVARDVHVVLEEAVVHEDMAAEGERVIVHRDHGGGGGCANVGEEGLGRGVGADVQEVAVVLRRLRRAVKEGSLTFAGPELFPCGRVPRYAEAVDVEHTVPGRDLVLGGNVVRIMREQLGEIVVVDLFGERMGLCDT